MAIMAAGTTEDPTKPLPVVDPSALAAMEFYARISEGGQQAILL